VRLDAFTPGPADWLQLRGRERGGGDHVGEGGRLTALEFGEEAGTRRVVAKTTFLAVTVPAWGLDFENRRDVPLPAQACARRPVRRV